MKKHILTVGKALLATAILSSCYSAQAHDFQLEQIKVERTTDQPAELINGYLRPQVWRNQTVYNLADPAVGIINIVTWPVQANQPIYGWRTHMTKIGVGQFGYNATYIGTTDDEGRFSQIYNAPLLDSLCGSYTNEQYAVGSPNGLKSTPINFTIIVDFIAGPPYPSVGGVCGPN